MKRLLACIATLLLATSASAQMPKDIPRVADAAKMAGFQKQLDDYVTNKALDGLFATVAAEEKNIRTNPAARTTDLLKTVFGK